MVGESMESRAARALQRTWQAIGADVLMAHGNVEEVTVGAEEVREAVTSCGFVGGYPAIFGDDRAAVEWLDGQPQFVQDALLSTAFPEGQQYGL